MLLDHEDGFVVLERVLRRGIRHARATAIMVAAYGREKYIEWRDIMEIIERDIFNIKKILVQVDFVHFIVRVCLEFVPDIVRLRAFNDGPVVGLR